MIGISNVLSASCGLETDMIKVLCNNNSFQSLNVSHLKSLPDMTFIFLSDVVSDHIMHGAHPVWYDTNV